MPRIITCLTFVLWFGATSGVAQNQKVVDSLESILTIASGNDRLIPLVDLAREFVDKDNEKALVLIKQAQVVASNSGDSLWIVKCLRIKGQVLLRLRRLEDAVEVFRVALAIAERNHLVSERIKILIPSAAIFIYTSKYDRALEMLSVAHELANVRQDTVNMRMVLNNLGVVYYKLKNYSKALEFWKSLHELQKITLVADYSPLMNMSLAYSQLKDYDKARDALNESLSSCGRDCGKAALVHINYASGIIFLGLGNYDKAEKDLLKSYKLSKEINDIRMFLDNICLLADIYQAESRPRTALLYLKDAEAVIINEGVGFNLEVIKIYQRFSETYARLQDFRKAASYQSKYIALKDSVYNEELTTSLMKAEADYLERYNEAQIASQKLVISLKEQVIERQRILSVLMTLLAFVILVCCAILYRNYRLKQSMNVSLEERIRERTHELEWSRNELLATLKERDVLLGRAEKEVLETMSTIKGLCHTGKEELNKVATYAYLEKIEKASGRLSRDLSLLFTSNQNG